MYDNLRVPSGAGKKKRLYKQICLVLNRKPALIGLRNNMVTSFLTSKETNGKTFKDKKPSKTFSCVFLRHCFIVVMKMASLD